VNPVFRNRPVVAAVVIGISVVLIFVLWNLPTEPERDNSTDTPKRKVVPTADGPGAILPDQTRNTSEQRTNIRPSNRNKDTPTQTADPGILSACETLRSALNEMESKNTRIFWEKEFEFGTNRQVAISAPDEKSIEQMSKVFAECLSRLPVEKQKEARERLQRIYDQYVDFKMNFRILNVLKIKATNTVRVIAFDAKSTNEAMPDENGRYRGGITEKNYTGSKLKERYGHLSAIEFP
jgi:hypothetical protein